MVLINRVRVSSPDSTLAEAHLEVWGLGGRDLSYTHRYPLWLSCIGHRTGFIMASANTTRALAKKLAG